MSTLSPAPLTGTQINWLEMARFAAAGEGHADLERGVQRLATLAAAVHRGVVGGLNQSLVDGQLPGGASRAHGWAPRVEVAGTDAGAADSFSATDVPGGRR